MGLSLATGPDLGGALVSAVGWRAIFWVNVPAGLAAITLTRRYVPESRAAHPRRLDPVAQVPIVILLAGLTAGIIGGPWHGWGSPLILGCFAAALLALIGVVVTELHRREPLIDVRFFGSAPFSGATVIAVTAFAAMAGFLFLNTLYPQTVRGYSPVLAGLLILPMAADRILGEPPPYLLHQAQASMIWVWEVRRCRHGSLPPAARMAWGVLPPARLGA